MIEGLGCEDAIEGAGENGGFEGGRIISHICSFFAGNLCANCARVDTGGRNDAAEAAIGSDESRKKVGCVRTQVGIAEELGIFVENAGAIFFGEFANAKIDALVGLSDFCVAAANDATNDNHRDEHYDAGGD